MPDWGQGAQGAVGGAATGAAYGSMIMPGWGTAIGGAFGGLAGGLGGLFGGGDEDPKDEYRKLLMDLYAGYKSTAKQIGPAAQAQQSGLVANRANYIAQLEQAAAGNGPSAARGLMQQGTDQGVRNATAMAQGAGGRGVNMGAALRNAQGQGAAMQMRNAQNMGIMRNQEQMQAQQMLGSAIGQGINSDNQMSQFNVGQMNNMEIQRAANALGITQLQMQMLMSAGNMAPAPHPGIGTSLLAGAANAVPGLLQMAQQSQQPGMPGVPQGAITSPGQVDPMAPYRRPDPGYINPMNNPYASSGPITMPGQLPPNY